MAKKKPTPKGQLGDWLEEVPEAVQEAADAYDKAHTAKSKASGKLNTAKESLIEKAKAHGCKRVPVRNGAKFLVISATDKVTYDTPKEDKPAA